MIFALKPEVAAVVGLRATQEANEAMRCLTGRALPVELVDAKLALQRTLFDLVPGPREVEEKDEP